MKIVFLMGIVSLGIFLRIANAEMPPLEIAPDTISLEKEIKVMSQKDATKKSLKILNWNVWMGTNGRGYLRMGDLEDVNTRFLRYELQEEAFKKLDADILFLQELSPVFKRADRLAKILNMDVVVQGDNCGLRVGNFGIPTNMQMGVAILAKKHLKLESADLEKDSLQVGQLPGFGFGFCKRWGAFQLSERRVYAAGTITWKNQDWTLINTHYTSKLGACREDLKQHCDILDAWEKNKEIKPKERKNIEAHLKAADQKRLNATNHLLKIVPLDSPVIISGDFNTTVYSPALKTLLNSGFSDLSANSGPTWSPSTNTSIGEGLLRQKELLSRTTPLEDLSFEIDDQDRKIDFIFGRNIPGDLSVTSKSLMFKPVQGHWLSDHFGIEVNLSATANDPFVAIDKAQLKSEPKKIEVSIKNSLKKL
jgi:endonuclease/exonuclease/phosphatase family metal-dependent hydrolase